MALVQCCILVSYTASTLYFRRISATSVQLTLHSLLDITWTVVNIPYFVDMTSPPSLPQLLSHTTLDHLVSSSSSTDATTADLDMAINYQKRKREEAQIKPELLALSKAQTLKGLTFDPAQHLSFKEYPQIHTMDEIGMNHIGVSNTAGSEPFQLFTGAAIAEMRAEVLSLPVLKNCQYSSNIAQCQLRGYSSK